MRLEAASAGLTAAAGTCFLCLWQRSGRYKYIVGFQNYKLLRYKAKRRDLLPFISIYCSLGSPVMGTIIYSVEI